MWFIWTRPVYPVFSSLSFYTFRSVHFLNLTVSVRLFGSFVYLFFFLNRLIKTVRLWWVCLWSDLNPLIYQTVQIYPVWAICLFTIFSLFTPFFYHLCIFFLLKLFSSKIHKNIFTSWFCLITFFHLFIMFFLVVLFFSIILCMLFLIIYFLSFFFTYYHFLVCN